MKYMLLFLLFLMIIPFNVNANVICNDGTVSPTCGVCSRGCCSHHGGCSNSYSNSSSSNSNDTNYNNSSYSNSYYEEDVVEDLEIKEIYLIISIVTSLFSFLIYLIFRTEGMY